MYWLFGILVCLNAHLPRLGGIGEDLELPTGQFKETLTGLRTGEGGGEGVGANGGVLGGGEEVESFINK